MKILLINPPSLENGAYIKEGRCQAKAAGELWPPITLGLIAAVLRKANLDSTLKDCVALNYSKGDLQELLKTKFDAIIVNSTTLTVYDDLKVANIIKESNDKAPIIFYGTHVTTLPDEVLSYNCVDYVIRREPELIALDLILALKNNKPLSQVKGISFKQDGKVIHNPDRELIKDLDELPFVARDLFPNEKYRIPITGEMFTIIRTSRGCPYQCTYCTSKLYYGKKWRTRSVGNILDEIEECVKKYNIKQFHLQSETFNLDKKMVLDFCKGIKERNLDIKWMCNSRVNLADEEAFTAMKKAGCWLIAFGTESGNQNLLDNIKKGANLSQAIKAFEITRKSGIKSMAYFMFSLPGETKETIRQSINFAKKLNPDYVRFWKVVPFPGTELYNQSEKNGWIKSKNWSHYDMMNNDVYEIDTISSKETTRMLKKAYLSFYLRPTFMLNQLKNKSPSEIWFTIKSGAKFLKGSLF